MTSIFRLALVAGFCLASGTALAALPDSSGNIATQTNPSPQATHVFEPGVLLEALRPLILTPVALENGSGPEANVDGRTESIETFDPIIVKEVAQDDNGEEIVRLQRDLDDPSADSDFWVRRSDLNEADFQITIPSLDDALATPEEDAPEVEYLTTAEARHGGKGHMRSRSAHSSRPANYCSRHPTAKHCCYSAVKYALQSMGLVNHRLGGGSGYMAARELAREHWREVGCGARGNPSVGMVCSYHGYTGGNGHAEVWKQCPRGGYGWYYGYRCDSSPVGPGCFSCKVKGSGSEGGSRSYHVRHRR